MPLTCVNLKDEFLGSGHYSFYWSLGLHVEIYKSTNTAGDLFKAQLSLSDQKCSIPTIQVLFYLKDDKINETPKILSNEVHPDCRGVHKGHILQ